MLIENNSVPLPIRPLDLSKADAAMSILPEQQFGVIPEHRIERLHDWSYLGTLPVPRYALEASRGWHEPVRWLARKPRWRGLAERWRDLGPTLSKSPHPRRALKTYAYTATQFNPAAASAILNCFLSKPGHVLDPCAGWGDRLAAALASPHTKSYVGWDANSANQAGYTGQIARYGDSTRYVIRHGAFEDAIVEKNKYALAFTSPPYFDAELYSCDPEQSTYRYPDWEIWRSRFLNELIRKCAEAILPGGVLVLSIPAFPTKDLPEPLTDACVEAAQRGGLRRIGYFVLPITKKKREPVFAWSKP